MGRRSKLGSCLRAYVPTCLRAWVGCAEARSKDWVEVTRYGPSALSMFPYIPPLPLPNYTTPLPITPPQNPSLSPRSRSRSRFRSISRSRLRSRFRLYAHAAWRADGVRTMRMPMIRSPGCGGWGKGGLSGPIDQGSRFKAQGSRFRFRFSQQSHLSHLS